MLLGPGLLAIGVLVTAHSLVRNRPRATRQVGASFLALGALAAVSKVIERIGLAVRRSSQSAPRAPRSPRAHPSQPVPAVSAHDVLRVTKRDYPPQVQAQVLELLAGYQSDSGEPHRVRLAILKLAYGRVGKLPDLLAAAKSDFRDVIACAEYPEYGKRLPQILFLNDQAELDAVCHADWSQYQAWLCRP
jgi:hypothetical protein